MKQAICMLVLACGLIIGEEAMADKEYRTDSYSLLVNPHGKPEFAEHNKGDESDSAEIEDSTVIPERGNGALDPDYMNFVRDMNLAY